MALLREGRETELTRGAYQEIFAVSRSQAAYDLAELVEAGMLERVGGGRSTRYVLVRQPNSTRRHWTSERIRAELADFCAGRPAWPSAREFKATGHTDLYVAASRYGGVGFWAAELGLPRAVRRWENAKVGRLRLSLSWATIGALGGALAVGAAVAIVQGLPRGTATPTAEHAAAGPAATSSSGKSSKPPTRKSAKHATTVKHNATVKKAKVVHTPTRQPRSAVATSTEPTAVLAVRTVSSPSPPAPSTTSTSSPPRSTTTSSSTATDGPTPLMAPRAGSATPAPLPPPTR